MLAALLGRICGVPLVVRVVRALVLPVVPCSANGTGSTFAFALPLLSLTFPGAFTLGGLSFAFASTFPRISAPVAPVAPALPSFTFALTFALPIALASLLLLDLLVEALASALVAEQSRLALGLLRLGEFFLQLF